VSSAGEICVNTLKKDWKASYGPRAHPRHDQVPAYLPESRLGPRREAGKLLQENYESYCERAKLITSVHATPKARPRDVNLPVRTTDLRGLPSYPGPTSGV